MHYLITHSLEKSAQKFPEKEAFKCLNKTLTYNELNKKTDQLALQLIKSGVQKGDRVGVYLNRCIETPLAIYGIMKAGAAYVPLNPNAPTAHTSYVINDCGIKHIVSNPTQKKGLAKVLSEKVEVNTIIGLSTDWVTPTISWSKVFELKGSPEPSLPLMEDDLAYILYTSGSTGKPKGIMHTHHSGLSYARLAIELYGLSRNDRFANHSPLHFDISTFCYFASPYLGASTVILTDAHTKMPASQAQLIEKENITVWYSVPLALLQMIQNGLLKERNMISLRWVLFAGEPFTTKHLRTLMQLWPVSKFSNIYGPTELNQCTYYNVPEPPKTDDPIPLGKFWGNTHGLILDENDREVAFGEIGELVVRSPTMMHGYWNKPELNETCFFHRITPSGIKEMYYRTGDLVRVDEFGDFVFLGRKDRQIKIRGYRIELDEIANVLLQHTYVVEAAVFTVKNLDGETAISAQVILGTGKNTSPEELKIFISALLPAYSVPEEVVIAEAFPRTATGKIDHLKLAET